MLRALLPLLWIAAMILVATTVGIPQTHAAVSSFFGDWLGLSPASASVCTNVVRKSFHVGAYALLGILVWSALPARRWRTAAALAVCLLVALADEVVQSMNPARTGRLTDVLLDLLGAGLAIHLLARRRRRRAASGGPEDDGPDRDLPSPARDPSGSKASAPARTSQEATGG